MSYIKRFFGHLKTVLTHKRWVFYYASRLGYTWRGLVHDLSKFSPVEFLESAKYWTGKRSPILAAKEDVGISYAWLHHKGRNKHHYEYWIDRVKGELVYHKIPFNYVIEMVSDWLAACRTYSNSGSEVFKREYTWWQKHEEKIAINDSTKKLIHKLLWNLLENEEHFGEGVALERVKEMLPHWKKMYEGDEYDNLYDETHL